MSCLAFLLVVFNKRTIPSLACIVVIVALSIILSKHFILLTYRSNSYTANQNLGIEVTKYRQRALKKNLGNCLARIDETDPRIYPAGWLDDVLASRKLSVKLRTDMQEGISSYEERFPLLVVHPAWYTPLTQYL